MSALHFERNVTDEKVDNDIFSSLLCWKTGKKFVFKLTWVQNGIKKNFFFGDRISSEDYPFLF
jgi:hypothetical protein